MLSPPGTLPPKPQSEPPDWLLPVLLGVVVVVLVFLLVFIGWPMLALLAAALLFGAGVFVGYRACERQRFERTIGKWLP